MGWSRKLFSVRPDAECGWRDEIDGAEGIAARFATEEEAIRATLAFAEVTAPSEVQIFDSAGKLCAQRRYGKEAGVPESR